MMDFRIQLPTKNSHALCVLPNSSRLYMNVRSRSFANFWTIQLESLDNVLLTEEVPLVFNPALLDSYPNVSKLYGRFYVTEVNIDVPLEDALNSKIKLYWRS
ncbi:MAG: hypothetical protein LBJ71_04060 [Holosporaceae bacterium]|jgi:hypothetical protein|nr:hypothetical protein [Holosporaceae bacterium]